MTAAVLIFILTYIAIASEKVDKAAAALLGTAVIAASGTVPYPVMLKAVDLNVVFLLLGMMIIVGILALTGIFECAAVALAQKAKGNGIVLVLLFLTATALISAFLDNVTTIILMAPVTILVSQILRFPAVPLLVLEAVFSNIGGTATLVGDPPNILIASQTGLTFNQFLLNLAPVIAFMTVSLLIVIYFIYRKTFTVNAHLKSEIAKAEPKRAVTEPIILRKALIISAMVLIGFFLSHSIGIDPGIIAVSGAMIMVLVTRVDLSEMLKNVEWSAILFFMGLFMMIGALEYVGVFKLLGNELITATGGNLLYTALAVLWFSALLSAFVDNIPLVIAMLPLIKTVIPVFAAQMGIAGSEELVRLRIAEPLYWSLALGACLGGNGTLIGASANIVVSQLALRNGYRMSFAEFSRIGLPIMIYTVIVSSIYIRYRYF